MTQPFGKMKPFSFVSKKKDLEAQKRFEEDAETAKVYEEYVSTFDQTTPTAKTFVRGATISSASGKVIDSKNSGDVYKADKMRELDRKRSDEHQRSSSEKSNPFRSQKNFNQKPVLKKGDFKKKTNMEAFKEELKMMYQDNNGRSSHGHHNNNNKSGKYSKHSNHYNFDDPNTTNIYCGNINPEMTELEFMEIFGLYGCLASVKIMFPRNEEEKARGRLSGFIAFLHRKDAENALKALDGQMIMDFPIKLGWGKAVSIASTPVFVPHCLRPPKFETKNSGLPFNAQVVDKNDQEFLEKYGDPRKLFVEDRAKFEDILSRTVVNVVIPKEKTKRNIINRVVEFVIRYGAMFEAHLMARVSNNHLYTFLFDNLSPDHIYYRWRLFSMLHGDGTKEWRSAEFRMFQNGSLWRPPYIQTYEMTDDLLPTPEELAKCTKNSFENNKGSDKGYLYEADREQLEDMLRNLTPQNDSIMEMAVFCIDHSDCWAEIVECITDSLCLKSTPLHKKLARLYLISEILSNCTAKVQNASYFRAAFQEKLISIFSSIHLAYDAIESRLKADFFKRRVTSVIRYWEETVMYSKEFLIYLQNIFLGLDSDANEEVHDDDVDGMPFDGAPMNDDDIDGVPIEHSKMFKASKWESVDFEEPSKSIWDDNYDDLDGEPIDRAAKREYSDDEDSSSVDSDGFTRKDLRNIEMNVNDYEDQLVSDIRRGKFKLKSDETIDDRVEQYRSELMRSEKARIFTKRKK